MLSVVGQRRARLLASAAVVAALSAGCFGATADQPRATSHAVSGREVVTFVNQARAANGLPSLSWNDQLGALAQDWSAHMAATGRLAHRDLQATITRPEFSGFGRLDENILVGACGITATEMHAAWMNSPGHRANILAPEADVIGIGVVCGADDRLWATQNFGRLL
jgi:uncharacterized protein YkwD